MNDYNSDLAQKLIVNIRFFNPMQCLIRILFVVDNILSLLHHLFEIYLSGVIDICGVFL